MKNAATAKPPSERAKLGAFLVLSVALQKSPPPESHFAVLTLHRHLTDAVRLKSLRITTSLVGSLK